MEHEINIDSLRNDLKADLQGAYFGGGFGGALMESDKVDSASPEELIQMAQNEGYDLNNYLLDA